MPDNKSNYLEQALLRHLFRQVSLTQPTSTTVSLHTADPTEDGSANEVSTGDWSNYARVTVNTDGATSPFWTDASVDGTGYKLSNSGDVDFGTATISTPVTVTHITVWDHASNPLYVGPLPSDQTINDGNPVKFPSGTLTIKEL